MQTAAWLVSTFFVGTLSYARGSVSSAFPQVNVVVTSDLDVVNHMHLRHGMSLASSMFAKAGVQIRWETRCPDANAEAQQIRVRIETNAPSSAPPDRLAFAKPFGSAEIVVFWNRLELASRHGRLSALAGHVLVHEITHILKSTAGHTSDGVMKAHWTDEDIWRMATHPLAFDSGDIKLIRYHLERFGRLNGMAGLGLSR